MMSKLVKNAAGRLVPTEINGQPAVPYQGVGKHRPEGRKRGAPIRTCADYPADGDKTVATIKEALQNAGLRDGMTISTHHHLRNGDYVANAVFAAAAELGVRDLRWVPSASFPCHAGMIDLMPDLVPVIDHVAEIPGLTVATGMSGHGFGIGPGVGRIVADLVTGDDPGHDLSRFRIDRFRSGRLARGPHL